MADRERDTSFVSRATALREALLAVLLVSACAADPERPRTDSASNGQAGSASGNPGSTGGASGEGGAAPEGGTAGAAGSGSACDGDPSNPYVDSQRDACYVAPAVDGVATCPAFDDPALPGLLSWNGRLGNGVYVRSVLGDIGQTPLSPSCVARAHCCEEQTDVVDRQTCLAVVRGSPASASCQGAVGGVHGGPYACSAAPESSAADRASCCYRTCGRLHIVGRPLLSGDGAVVAALITRLDWQAG